MGERNVHVVVVYKGGAVVEFDCEHFTARHTFDNELVGAEWTNARPRPFHFGVDDVAAIYVTGPEGAAESNGPTNNPSSSKTLPGDGSQHDV